jgi:hypothetical protein
MDSNQTTNQTSEQLELFPNKERSTLPKLGSRNYATTEEYFDTHGHRLSKSGIRH